MDLFLFRYFIYYTDLKLLPYRATYCEMDIICLFTILLFLFSFFCFYRYYRVTLNTISDGKPYPIYVINDFFLCYWYVRLCLIF